MAIFPEGDGTVLPVSKTRLAICVAGLPTVILVRSVSGGLADLACLNT